MNTRELTPQIIAPEPELPGQTMDEETLLPTLPRKRYEPPEPVQDSLSKKPRTSWTTTDVLDKVRTLH